MTFMMSALAYASSQTYDEFGNQFKAFFPNLEEVNCFLRKPLPLIELVKAVKSQLGLL